MKGHHYTVSPQGLTERITMAKVINMKTLVLTGVAFSLMACSSGTDFNLNGEENIFQQSVSQTQVKVDILWVVDDSGSMATSQDNVAANFQSFIDKFQQTNFDFQIAVVDSSAWRANAAFNNDPIRARFKDGRDVDPATPGDNPTQSGVFVIKPDTPDLEQTFITNIQQGVTGDADERGWQSMQEALSLQANLDEPFPRENSLLAVIFLTDEDDFSHDGSANMQAGGTAPGGGPLYANPYDNPNLHDHMQYYDFLFDLTGSTEGNLNFSVNTIGIFDETCLNQLNTTWTGRKIASRYVEVTDATGGYKGSLCDDFSDVMAGITDSIIQKTTAFKLNREPAVDSIVVKVNDETIPQDSENGWSYNPETVEVIFNGSSIPGSGDQVSITFDPAGLL